VILPHFHLFVAWHGIVPFYEVHRSPFWVLLITITTGVPCEVFGPMSYTLCNCLHFLVTQLSIVLTCTVNSLFKNTLSFNMFSALSA
jgi:hypothetical protein